MFKFKALLALVVGLSVAALQVWAAEAKLTPKVPKGVILPYRYFANSEQFTKPTEGDGTVSPHAVVARFDGPIPFQMAIDTTAPDATQPDVVRFDFTNQGRFAYAPTAALKIISSSGATLEGSISPDVIEIPVGGQPVGVRVRGSYQKYGTANRQVKISLDIGLQAQCDFSGKRYTVCVVDGTGNLLLGDAHKPVVDNGKVSGRIPGDTLMIDTGDGTFKDCTKVVHVVYGQPVWVDGAWYEVTVGGDGKSISVQRADLPTGWIKVANTNWEMLLVSPDRVMWLESTQAGQEVPVPAGRYVMMRYKQYLKFGDNSAGAILVEGSGPYQGHLERSPDDPVVDVAPDKTVDLPVGSPLTAKPQVSQSDQYVRFSLKVTDASGRQPDYVQLASSQRPAVTVRVLDGEAKEVYSGKMEYG